jgi:hypothetical protein
MVESFSDNVRDAILQNGKIVDPSELYQEPSVNNPFANVMMSDYDTNPNKTSGFVVRRKRNIKQSWIKPKLIDKLNPTQPNMSDTLFKDLGEFEFRTVHASVLLTPSTTIPNDAVRSPSFIRRNDFR